MWNRDDVARFPSTAIAYRSIFVLVGDLDVRRFLEPIFLHHRRNLFSFWENTFEEKQLLHRTIAYLLLFTILFARMTSVLERGRDRIFRQFHAVYRYDHDDRSLRGDALLWLRFTSAFRVSMFRYVTTFCLSPLFIRSITCSIPLDRPSYPRSAKHFYWHVHQRSAIECLLENTRDFSNRSVKRGARFTWERHERRGKKREANRKESRLRRRTTRKRATNHRGKTQRQGKPAKTHQWWFESVSRRQQPTTTRRPRLSGKVLRSRAENIFPGYASYRILLSRFLGNAVETPTVHSQTILSQDQTVGKRNKTRTNAQRQQAF